MAAVQRGDTAAYRTLLDDIGPEVTRFLRARIPNRHDVGDLYQETFLALHRARHTYRFPLPVEPWLFAIAAHVVARYMRRYRVRMGREVLVDAPPEHAIGDGGSMRLQLVQALDRLPPAHRQAIELLKLEGLSAEAAAVRAGTTPGAFRVRAHRAYKALRQLLGS
jgi:RNA polymerase sigma-70 factor (ECF subfamily)